MPPDVVPAVERICDDVAKRMQEMGEELRGLRGIIDNLLRRTGHRGSCNNGPNCRAEVWFVRYRDAHKVGVYNSDGTSHSSTCPYGVRFRRKKEDESYVR